MCLELASVTIFLLILSGHPNLVARGSRKCVDRTFPTLLILRLFAFEQDKQFKFFKIGRSKKKWKKESEIKKRELKRSSEVSTLNR